MANINILFDAFTKLNEWWSVVKTNFISLNDQLVNHISGANDKHAAQDITYSGNATGNNIKVAIDNLNTDIGNLSFTGSEHDALVTAAMVDEEGVNFGSEGTATYLDGRLKKWEQKLLSHEADYLKHKISVKDFGAKGDWNGTTGTDDTISIQNAINYLVSIGGGTLFFPNGNYKISKIGTRVLSYSDIARSYSLLINNTSNITIQFDANASIYCPVGDTLVTNAFWVESSSNINFYSPKFIGIGATTTLMLEEGVGVSFVGCNNCKVFDSYSENMRGNARGYISNNINICDSFSKIYAEEHSSSHFCLMSCSNSTISNCETYGCSDDGDIFIYGGDSKNCTIKSCSSYSYVFGDATKTIPDLSAQGIAIDGSSRDCQLLDNYVYGYYYGFNLQSGSEGSIISNCTAEKCKVGICIREGEIPVPPTIAQVLGNSIVPNGGNGNTVVQLGTTEPIGIILMDCYGGAIVNGNIIYNSVDIPLQSNFTGLVCGQTYSKSDDVQGNILITNNNFAMDNKIEATLADSKKQAIIITSAYSVRNITIEGNTFDLPQSGMLTNVIEAYNCFGLSISNNTFTNLPVTGLPLIKVANSFRIKINGNVIGYHWGILDITNSQGLSFNDNVSAESIAGISVPALAIVDTQNITINNNNQLLTTTFNADGCYFVTSGTTNWLVAIGNMLNCYNKDNTNWYEAVIPNVLIEHNVVK